MTDKNEKRAQLAPNDLLNIADGAITVSYTHLMLAGLTLLAAVIYIKTLRISLWKSGTIALSVCAVFACINSLARALNAAMPVSYTHLGLPEGS